MKRFIDICLCCFALALLWPLLLVVVVMCLAQQGRPIFFRQQRAGLNGNAFNLLKFRTMTDARDESGALLPDHERLTPIGEMLRSTSMDELPEIYNILRGEMSWVGPRPLPLKYLARYTPEQARRHEVLPGLTGWAQVNGRNATTWSERFKHDLFYVEHRNLLLDLQILFQTVGLVLRREGIAEDGQATMSEFKGNHGSPDQ